MTRQIITGIDIGTSKVRVVVAEELVEQGYAVTKIIGTGISESRGLRRGYINNVAETSRSLKEALAKAEKLAGVKIRRAYVSFGGVGLGSITSNGTVAISRADMEITERDMALSLEAAEANIPKSALLNRRIINTVPVEYKIDGQSVWGEAPGLKGQKLEVKALFITCLEHHLANLISVVEEAGIEVADVVAAPVAESLVTLSKKQKRVGSILVDIGAETLSLVVFENDTLLSLEVFPFGSNDITNDLALGLKVSPKIAENIKLGEERREVFSKKKAEEVIKARLSDYFELIERHLKSINRHALLPAGIIIAGGGAEIENIREIASHSLKLPAELAEVYFGDRSAGKIKDHTWAVACGLAMLGFNADGKDPTHYRGQGTSIAEGSRRLGGTLSRWVSQFLP